MRFICRFLSNPGLAGCPGSAPEKERAGVADQQSQQRVGEAVRMIMIANKMEETKKIPGDWRTGNRKYKGTVKIGRTAARGQ